MTWPVLAGDDERWAVRAAIDAVVADAYGLSRDQYAHVLSTFSHASYRKAPELCLARFDELKKLGLETFTRKYDPLLGHPLEREPPPARHRPAHPRRGQGGRRRRVPAGGSDEARQARAEEEVTAKGWTSGRDRAKTYGVKVGRCSVWHCSASRFAVRLRLASDPSKYTFA